MATTSEYPLVAVVMVFVIHGAGLCYSQSLFPGFGQPGNQMQNPFSMPGRQAASRPANQQFGNANSPFNIQQIPTGSVPNAAGAAPAAGPGLAGPQQPAPAQPGSGTLTGQVPPGAQPGLGQPQAAQQPNFDFGNLPGISTQRPPSFGGPMMPGQQQQPSLNFGGSQFARNGAQPRNTRRFRNRHPGQSRVIALQDLVETTGSLQPGQSQTYGFFGNDRGNFSIQVKPCRGLVNWQVRNQDSNVEHSVRPMDEAPELFINMPFNKRKRRQLAQPGGNTVGRSPSANNWGAPVSGPGSPANNVFPSMANPIGNQQLPNQLVAGVNFPGQTGGGMGGHQAAPVPQLTPNPADRLPGGNFPPGNNFPNMNNFGSNPAIPGGQFGSPGAGGGGMNGFGPSKSNIGGIGGAGTPGGYKVSASALNGPPPVEIEPDFEYEEPMESEEFGLGSETAPVSEAYEKTDISGGEYSVLITNPLQEPVVYRILMTRNIGNSPYPRLPEEKQVRVTKVRPTAVEVSWDPVKKEKNGAHGGQAQHVNYCIEYSPAATSRVTDRHSSTCGTHRTRPGATIKVRCTDQTSILITNLQPATSYFVDVYATNVNVRPQRQSAYQAVNVTTLPAGIALPNNRVVSNYALPPSTGQIFTFSEPAVNSGMPTAVKAMVVPCTGLITWALTRDGWPVEYFEPEFLYDDDDSFSDDDDMPFLNPVNPINSRGPAGGVDRNFPNNMGSPNFAGGQAFPDPFAPPGIPENNPFAVGNSGLGQGGQGTFQLPNANTGNAAFSPPAGGAGAFPGAGAGTFPGGAGA
eukprot:scpid48808/ scgid21406/ 